MAKDRRYAMLVARGRRIAHGRDGHWISLLVLFVLLSLSGYYRILKLPLKAPFIISSGLIVAIRS